MHIIALTGSYYPNIMAPSACVRPYLLELAKDNEIEVVCPVSNSHFYDNVTLDNISIHFVTNRLNSVFAKANTNIADNKHKYLSKFQSFFVRGVRYFQEEFSPAIYDATLANSYLEKLEEINNKNKIDVIISVTFPFLTHVVALKFKQRYPKVKWLTYTTDPLAHNEANPIPKWKKEKAEKIEQEVYDNCDYCLITEELFGDLTEGYHIPEQKVVVLSYLIETNDEPQVESRKQSDRIQALYAGCLFYRVRNPQKMLEVFSAINDVDLQLYVTGDRTCRKMLKKSYPQNIKIHGLVPRDEYLRVIGQADILINLSNNAKLQAPHKLMELISTGRPIINFYYYKNSGYNIIERYPIGINISNDSKLGEVLEIINKFVLENKENRLTDLEITELYPEYLLPYQMAHIKQLLQV